MSDKMNSSQKNVPSTKKTKRSQKQTIDPISEKFENLLKLCDKVLADWKKCSVLGNKILNEEILAKKKEQFCSEDTTTVPFDLKLQKSIEKLGKVAIELNHYVQNLEDAVEKIDALINLSSLTIRDSNLSINTSEMSTTNLHEHSRSRQLEALNVLVKCYRNQTELNNTVAKNIGTAPNLEHTIYYTCIWNHQPAIGNDCFIAERQFILSLDL